MTTVIGVRHLWTFLAIDGQTGSNAGPRVPISKVSEPETFGMVGVILSQTRLIDRCVLSLGLNKVTSPVTSTIVAAALWRVVMLTGIDFVPQSKARTGRKNTLSWDERKTNAGPRYRTRTSGSTDIPGLSKCSRSCPFSKTIFTGMRWTTLT